MASLFGQISPQFGQDSILFNRTCLTLGSRSLSFWPSRQLTCLPIIGKFFRCHFASIDGITTALCVKTTHIAHELVENIIHVVKVVVHMSTSFLIEVLAI